MIWHRLKLIVLAGTALILALMAGGTALMLERSRQVAIETGEAALERAGQAVENALARQILQVQGALASLRNLFEAARASPHDPDVAAKLLQSLNFQTLAFRDLLLVGPDTAIIASARPRPARRPLPVNVSELTGEPSVLLGPVRNAITGDWSLFVVRAVPGWDGITPVAEVPVATLMALLAETGVPPDVRIMLERSNGQLLGALPHDEVQTGQVREDGPEPGATDGKAFTAGEGERAVVAVARASLYNDVRVVLVADRSAMLSEWRLDRERTLAAASGGGLLIAAFAGALLFALRQRELAEGDRMRAAAVLANAVDAMSDGFAMWDGQDRLVTCNQRYRDLYAPSAPFLVPGIRFEEVVRRGTSVGQYPEIAASDLDAFVADHVRWHRQASGAKERRLPDGRWMLMKERRTADGGIVGIRTDITALKTTLADLADANARATEAAAEAERRNEALVERESRIRYLAHHDELTGLPNRVLFRGQMQAALEAAQARGEAIALLYLDLDRFKDVNDTLGHPAGDALLRAVAARLGNCVGDADCVARLSGDEFAVISIAPDQPASAEALSRRIIEELSRPYALLGHTVGISVSVGIAVTEGDADADVLLKRADLALYRAKARGRATVCLFAPEMDAHLHARLQMEADLANALKQGEFELVYQPIFALATGRVSGVETLLRWNHPRHGLVGPTDFIPLAEETRLICDIGTFVLEQACADAALLPAHLRVAINLSPVQLELGDIVGTVADVLQRNALEPGRLELEITETALFSNDQRTMEVLQSLRALGVRIVLDDFGTGYSSLSHLCLFPLDKIKIDRSFVQEMTVRSDSAAIVEAVAALAQRLGMSTTAEGVETEEQLAVTRRAGCTEAQGNLLGEPRPIDRARVDFGAPPPGAERAGGRAQVERLGGER